MTKVLGIDTSGSFCSIAVSSASGDVFAESSSGAGDHFEQLPSMVERVCSLASISLSELSQIRIGCGPGSFTGLRIGMSFAKGLAVGLKVPVIGLSSFSAAAAVAFEQNPEAQQAVVVADARRDEFFFGLYDRAESVAELVAPRIATLAEMGIYMKSSESRGTVWVSPQFKLSVPGVSVPPEPHTAKGLLRLPAEKVTCFQIEEIAVLEPAYLREVAAKTIEERKQGA